MTTASRTSTTAIASLVFGVISWFGLFFVGGLVAVICGHVARAEIRRAPPGSIEGDGMALAGLVLGWINILVVVPFLLFILMVLFLPLFSHSITIDLPRAL